MQERFIPSASHNIKLDRTLVYKELKAFLFYLKILVTFYKALCESVVTFESSRAYLQSHFFFIQIGFLFRLD